MVTGDRGDNYKSGYRGTIPKSRTKSGYRGTMLFILFTNRR